MKEFNLWARDGHFSTPDGNSIYFWGFSPGTDEPAQVPGNHLIVNQGETVKVKLTNMLENPVSIMFPGQKGVEVDGNLVQPQYKNGSLASLTNYAEPGEVISYTFTPDKPGTYIYESGTNPHLQVPLGLYGAIVVRPEDFNDSNKTAYGQGTDTEFDREYLMVFQEIDPILHQAVEKNEPYQISERKPRYWLINGRAAPDTMMPENVGYLPNQPYGSMIMCEPGEKVLLRYVGMGFDTHPLHPHGNHTRVIARDGNLLRNNNYDRSYQRFTVVAGPGQTCDQIFEWEGLGYTEDNPIPTTIPNLRNMGIGEVGWTMWSGNPYLGQKGDVPQDVVSFNESGEYYFMLHSHAELQITNWGEFPGGMMTMIGIYSLLSPEVGKIE